MHGCSRCSRTAREQIRASDLHGNQALPSSSFVRGAFISTLAAGAQVDERGICPTLRSAAHQLLSAPTAECG